LKRWSWKAIFFLFACFYS